MATQPEPVDEIEQLIQSTNSATGPRPMFAPSPVDSRESFRYRFSIVPKSSKVFFNSIVYYLNVGYFLDKEKKWELLLDANTTLNGPVISENIFYYNDNLIEKSINKVNLGFIVLKLRITL